MQPNGVFLALYGVNGIGKSVQTSMLAERLREGGKPLRTRSLPYWVSPRRTVKVKYPLYWLSPTGPRLNAYLRKGNPEGLSALEFQKLNVENRTAFDEKIRDFLAHGITVVAEDYIGTGVAWGAAAGLSRSELLSLNEHLVQPAASVLLDGVPFMGAVEHGHRHEENRILMRRARQEFFVLAQLCGWRVVKANHHVDAVHECVLSAFSDVLGRP